MMEHRVIHTTTPVQASVMFLSVFVQMGLLNYLES